MKQSKPARAYKSGDTNKYRALMQKIADHGVQEIEVAISGRTVTASRVLIMLELLFNKAIDERSLGAAQQYLDRILGKPKESLTLDNGSDIGKISDSELIERLITTIKKAGEREPGDPGK